MVVTGSSPTDPQARKILKDTKKWLKSDFRGPGESDSKVTQKWYFFDRFWVTFESLLSNFWVTFTGTPKKAKSGNLNLFLRILLFFPLFSLYFARKKGQNAQKKVQITRFCLESHFWVTFFASLRIFRGLGVCRATSGSQPCGSPGTSQHYGQGLWNTLFSGENLMCANTQPFLCNELGPFQAIFRQSAWALFRYFQALPGNFRQFQPILGNFGQF